MVNVDPYLHAVLLLKGADKEISEANITSVVKAAGVSPDTAKVKVLAEAVKNVNWDEALKMPMMGAAAAPAAAAPAAKAEKKEEKKEEKTEEEAAAGLAGLFG